MSISGCAGMGFCAAVKLGEGEDGGLNGGGRGFRE